ncbi:MAG: hypothetical protein LUQ36_02810 [Methanoregula sp.]|nr:hypothetical protein [Methanoregula sp.]
MQTNSTIVSVFILFPALQGGVIHCADGETLATKILSLAFTVIGLILFSIMNLFKTIDPAGTMTWYFPSNKAGLHQK